MTPLVKFCRPEHNLVNGCHTIQLGTLEYYRGFEETSHLSDKAEGIESVIIRSLDTDSCSTEAARAIAPVIDMPHVQVSNIALSVTAPNCYLWCCARSTEPHDPASGRSFDLSYTSSFRIDDANIFAGQLARLLVTYGTLTDFGDQARLFIERIPVGDLGQITLHWHHQEVQYVDQKKSEISSGKIATYGVGLPAPLRQMFTKPARYAVDREYRFLFWFEHPRCGILGVRKDPLILPVLPISRTTMSPSSVS